MRSPGYFNEKVDMAVSVVTWATATVQQIFDFEGLVKFDRKTGVALTMLERENFQGPVQFLIRGGATETLKI